LSLAGQLSNPTQISTSGPLLNQAQQTDSVNQAFQTQLGLGFDWTLFDGGILAAEAEALRSRSRQGFAKADLERLRVTRQVQDNQAELINSLILIKAAADQLSVPLSPPCGSTTARLRRCIAMWRVGRREPKPC
jgi:hypothetical protein